MLKWQSKTVKISDLKEYEHNPRKITDKLLEKLATHIKEDGYHQRIIVDNDHTIIGGHQRKKGQTDLRRSACTRRARAGIQAGARTAAVADFS